jgi:hypothetical protein
MMSLRRSPLYQAALAERGVVLNRVYYDGVNYVARAHSHWELLL